MAGETVCSTGEDVFVFRDGCDVRKAIAKHHGNPIVKAIISDWICLDTTRNNTIMFSGGAVRAFRNQPDVRYFRKVHENLTIQYENFVFEPELKLYHTGYSGDVNRSKHERNLRIMRTMFDFDNGKVEFPTDWRYIEDTYEAATYEVQVLGNDNTYKTIDINIVPLVPDETTITVVEGNIVIKDKAITTNKLSDALKNNIQFCINGATSTRPENVSIGCMYFDTTINKPIWKTSSGWVDAYGNNV